MRARITVRLLVLAGAVALLPSCCHRERLGQLSDGTVIVAGKAGGGVLDRPKPVEGAPLASALIPGSSCMPSERLLSALGPTCSHESENPAPAAPSAELGGGKPARTREVRWYCDERFVVRVVFEPCDADNDGKTDGITPVEVGVATHPPKAQ